jgi:hypothetical protein
MTFNSFVSAGRALVLAGALAGFMAAAQAHPSPSSEVLLSVGARSITAEVTLPVDELRLAFPGPLVDASGKRALAGDARIAAYLVAHIRPVAPDGRAWVVKVEGVRWELDRTPADVVAEIVLRPPAGAPVGTLELGFDAIAHRVPNHLTLVALRTGHGPDARPHMLASLHYGHRSVAIRDAEPRWWSGCTDLFKLGMAHIAQGADHLLFLLTLLLPAALRVDGRRWGGFAGTRPMVMNLLAVVTAFTAGHSLTLVLGALGIAVLPSQPVEAAIALSILVSAAHAWRPIFPRREAWIAGGFGLVHGLAFAGVIRDLQLDGVRLAAGILAFNLGIETVQALLVLLLAPLLVLLARSASYPRVRQGAALMAAAMALVWMTERLAGVAIAGMA